MNRIFIGFDERAPIQYNVAQFSLMRRSSEPLAITPLVLQTMPISRRGLTAFTYSRFMVPMLCDWKGWALFLDSDIVAVADICELFREADPNHAVMVVNVDQPFERAAVMLYNCAHPDNYILQPEFVERSNDLHQIGWTNKIGRLSRRWQYVVGYDESPPENCGLVHYTRGVPAWPETMHCASADIWRLEHRAMNATVSWIELMGQSVHAETMPAA